MYEQAPKIRLVTNNTYGEFSFYTTLEELQEYLDETLKTTVSQFLEGNSMEGNRQYFNWIKARSNKMSEGNRSRDSYDSSNGDGDSSVDPKIQFV